MNNNQHLWKILYLILSIVIAAGVWYYVDESSGRVVTQTVSGIPIEYINEDALTDKGLMLEETENSGTSTTVDIAAGMPSRRMYSTCMGCPPEAEGVMAL